MTYLTTVLTDQKTNLSFQKTTVTSSQNVTTSWVLVEGGQMSYTPTSATAEVMVEFTTAFGKKDADNSIMLRLQIGETVATLGDVVTDNIDYHNDFGAGSNSNSTNTSDNITVKYKLSGWSGEKIIQIQCKTYASLASTESVVNATRPASTDLLYNPFMMMYEV